MSIGYLGDVLSEINALPIAERKAMVNALDKLALLGDQLGFPHSSQVKGTTLRELRPRAGRAPWRAFYRRVGDHYLVAAIGPEALHDPRGFQRAINLAHARLEEHIKWERNMP